MTRLKAKFFFASGVVISLVAVPVGYVLSLPRTDPDNEELESLRLQWDAYWIIFGFGIAFLLIGGISILRMKWLASEYEETEPLDPAD